LQKTLAKTVQLNIVFKVDGKALRDLLQVTGLTKRLGKDNIFPSVRAAVRAYHARFSTPESIRKEAHHVRRKPS
jgi:hypothetical protein